MGAAYADDIIQKLLEFEKKTNTMLDHISDGLQTDYSAADFIRERTELETMLADVEQELKAGMLYALEDPGSEQALNLQDSLQKIDAEIKESHNLQQRLLKNTRSAATRFNAASNGE